MLRPEAAADDYYRSKILADREVLRFLDDQPDFWAALVLPGWMHGPGDQGPTSAGQMVVDFMHRRLPGIPPGGFSVVDARDVAAAMIAAAERGVRGRRYLAAGRPVEMAELGDGAVDRPRARAQPLRPPPQRPRAWAHLPAAGGDVGRRDRVVSSARLGARREELTAPRQIFDST
jgi:dihydroflavonol-4-reductase